MDRSGMRTRFAGLALALTIGLAPAGCVHRRADLEGRDLEARVTGPPPEAGPARSGSDSDASVERASAGVPDRPAASPEAAAIPAGPMTLEDARGIALRSSPVLAQATASVDAALGNLEVADSGFYPTFQGDYGFQAYSSAVGFTGTRGRFPVLPVRGFGPGTQDFHVTEVQMKWTIFQFGKQLARHDQGAFRAEVAKLERERACQTVSFDVARAYFQALEARSSVEIAERAVERAEVFAKEAGDLERRGVITREEQLRAEAALAGVRQARVDAVSEEEVAVAALNRAMGINVNAPTRVAERREAPRFDLSLEQSLQLAVANRREIPVVTRGVAIAQGDVDIARADFLPSVSLQAGYSNVTGTGVQNANVGAGGIFLSQDLFSGGRRRGQLRAAEAGVRSAAAQAQQVCDGIAFEVNVAYRGVEDARERIGAARAVFDQAKENLRLVESRARAGDATPAEVSEAQAGETRSEQTFNAAIYQYQRALARLEYAVGAELPVAPGSIPEAAPPRPEDRPVPPVPPDTPSPFDLRSAPGALPGLPSAPDLGGAAPTRVSPLPSPAGPSSPAPPGLLGPASPSLSRPPYESSAPIGNRP